MNNGVIVNVFIRSMDILSSICSEFKLNFKSSVKLCLRKIENNLGAMGLCKSILNSSQSQFFSDSNFTQALKLHVVKLQC